MSKFTESIQRQIDRARESAAAYGWAFKERTPAAHTIGDLIGAVLAIDNDADAAAFYAGYLEFLRALPDQHEQGAEHVALANIGWCYGEGMADERIAMWRRTTGAAHPIFGGMTTRPTPEEALTAGMNSVRGSHDR